MLLVPGAILAGIAADVLVRALSPSPTRPAALRTVAFAIPAIYFALYLASLALTRGVWWSVPLWSGAIIEAGAVGWLASWLVVRRPFRAREHADAPRETHAARRHPVSY